jgi:hypothetical protein
MSNNKIKVEIDEYGEIINKARKSESFSVSPLPIPRRSPLDNHRNESGFNRFLAPTVGLFVIGIIVSVLGVLFFTQGSLSVQPNEVSSLTAVVESVPFTREVTSTIIPSLTCTPVRTSTPAPTFTPIPSRCNGVDQDNSEPGLWWTEPRMSGEAVVSLQRRLIELGYELPEYGIDGWYGPETEAAVKEFQLRNGLKVDGYVGPITWACLKNQFAAPAR